MMKKKCFQDEFEILWKIKTFSAWIRKLAIFLFGL